MSALKSRVIQTKVGLNDNVLDIAQYYDLPIIEGCCAGSKACSTCHVIINNSVCTHEGVGMYDTFLSDKTPGSNTNELTEEEEDMLDLAFKPTEHSRLGCCLYIKQEHNEKLLITIPEANRNLNVDGYHTPPH